MDLQGMIGHLYDLSRDELRALAHEALLISDGLPAGPVDRAQLRDDPGAYDEVFAALCAAIEAALRLTAVEREQRALKQRVVEL